MHRLFIDRKIPNHVLPILREFLTTHSRDDDLSWSPEHSHQPGEEFRIWAWVGNFSERAGIK